ncbi:glycine betaine/L-proline ABC transporter substrate-binding protein ProX [Mesorhizobium onobrychidis]|uniref:Glycine betaine/L-proline ABC transporter substrate-binding protein ProX n=1 Tax=Mesorhizobium onobrychidis TaxID=2775404 RepID=A0ABY5QW92_9HYPH|nr:glycine betaine/L-proline ABC transporter substrate-binding protein ProX [Mesorhizobium onobrychidis]UVC15358.1 glycine betaine/L-proline ABC transporter substrate-binding protein ProX [Mesorhizobium onobrychidis]
MKIKAAILASLLLGISSSTHAAERVRPAWNGTPDTLFQTYVVMQGLKDLGYDVAEPAQLQIELYHVTIGNGDLDFNAEHWEPLHKAFWEKAGGAAKLMPIGKLWSNAVQGYLIDKKTADATGIKYLEDLKDPEKAKLFDIDGDEKADLYGCDPGWGCERVIEHQLDAYGLRDTVEHLQGGYNAIIPDAIERFKEGKPVLYYSWTPFWLSSVLRPGKDVVWLNVKETSLPDGQTGSTTVPGLGNLGFPVNDVMIIANTAFLKANPSAKKFFELVQIPTEDINAENQFIFKGEKSNEQVLKRTTDWIAAHKSEWDKWIAEAKATK